MQTAPTDLFEQAALPHLPFTIGFHGTEWNRWNLVHALANSKTLEDIFLKTKTPCQRAFLIHCPSTILISSSVSPYNS